MSQLNQTFARERRLQSPGECLAQKVSCVSTSQRLLGFAVSSNIDYKVSFAFTTRPIWKNKNYGSCGWNECSSSSEVQGSNSYWESCAGCVSFSLFDVLDVFPLSKFFLAAICFITYSSWRPYQDSYSQPRIPSNLEMGQ